MNFVLDINPTDKLISDRGLEKGGRVQAFIDSECIRCMAPYTPFLSGTLERSATIGTIIGSGEIKQTTPYARYQYYGKLMVDSETGSAYASPYGMKVLTDKDLEYNTSRHPLAGSHWFERMKSDHKDKILQGAQKLAGR